MLLSNWASLAPSPLLIVRRALSGHLSRPRHVALDILITYTTSSNVGFPGHTSSASSIVIFVNQQPCLLAPPQTPQIAIMPLDHQLWGALCWLLAGGLTGAPVGWGKPLAYVAHRCGHAVPDTTDGAPEPVPPAALLLLFQNHNTRSQNLPCFCFACSAALRSIVSMRSIAIACRVRRIQDNLPARVRAVCRRQACRSQHGWCHRPRPVETRTSSSEPRDACG